MALGLAVTDRLLAALPGVTEAKARRVREGMTPEQVEAAFGGPPTARDVAATDRRTAIELAARPYLIGWSYGWTPNRLPWTDRWEGAAGYAEVSFGSDERVTEVH